MSKEIKKFLNYFYQFKKKRTIIKSDLDPKKSKNALFSYILTPFKKKNSYTHTNYITAKIWVEVLNDLDYNVDIIHYNYCGSLDFEKYDLLCGFGEIFQKYYESTHTNLKSIYYGTGTHINHQNHATLKRVKDVFKKKNVWLGKSARYVEKAWTHQTYLVDGIITLDGGNNFVKNSYQKFYSGPIYTLPTPVYIFWNGKNIVKKRTQENKKNYLWFGSKGMIHKGLDLVLDFFSRNPEYILHVCGSLEAEPKFIQAYHKELNNFNNIKVHGFVDISSKKFQSILSSCDFLIYPSCSEAGPSSAYNVIANGALIPIVTKETSLSTGYELLIESYSYEGVKKAVEKSQKYKHSEIEELRKKNWDYTVKNHTNENYYSTLKSSILEICS